jgi:peptide deformylase
MDLIFENSPILRQPCNPVDFSSKFLLFDPEELARNMIDTMRVRRGLGLAAPQVGLLYRLFVMGDETQAIACFNPEILETSSETFLDQEGCLSYPNLWLSIARPTWIIVKYQDATGKEQQSRFELIWSRCFSHELEHLDGVCFIDKVSKLKLDMAKKRRLKQTKG